MADTRSPLRSLLSLTLLAATALGLFNVYADSTDVEKKAALAACAGEDCPFTVSQGSKNPLFHQYTLVVQPRKQSKRSVDVECRRALYLVGEYSCSIDSPR